MGCASGLELAFSSFSLTRNASILGVRGSEVVLGRAADFLFFLERVVF